MLGSTHSGRLVEIRCPGMSLTSRAPYVVDVEVELLRGTLLERDRRSRSHNTESVLDYTHCHYSDMHDVIICWHVVCRCDPSEVGDVAVVEQFIRQFKN